jgi:hypothetical protein
MAPFRAAGLRADTRLRVEAAGQGRVVLTQLEDAIEEQTALLSPTKDAP